MNRIIYKKTVAFILTFIMIMSSVPSTFAASPADFVDFPTGWSAEAVTAAVNNGLLNGRTENTIAPEGLLTRAEMATIINRAFGATVEADISGYTDVPTGEWYYHEIAKAVNMQTFEGDGNNAMRPNDSITRQEVFAVIARALVLESSDYSSLNKFNDAGDVSSWAKPYASILVEKNYVNGDDLGNLNPLANITRAEFAQIMHNIVKTYFVGDGEYRTTGTDSTLIRCANVTLADIVVEGDLILGDGVGKGDVTLINVTIKGRLLARGGEGKVTLKNTTVGEGVVVKDVNGTVNFNNYRTETPFKNIREITPATFLKKTTSSGTSSASKVSYTIYHYVEDENGGTYKEYDKVSGRVNKGSKITLNALGIIGYMLDASAGDGARVGQEVTLNSDTEFKLYYKAKKHTVTVNIVLSDGTPSQREIEYKHGETFGTRFNMDAHPDTKFYYVSTDGSEVEITPSLPITTGITVLTKKAYTVTFDFNDGSGTTREVKVYNGEKLADKLVTPTRKGYVFSEWNTKADGTGDPFTSESIVSAPITVYAQWTKETYDITYSSQFAFKDENAITKTYDIETTVTLPSESDFADHTGYIFDGWYKEADHATKVNAIEAGNTGDITLYAKWLSESVVYKKVTFNYNYTGAPASVTVSVENGKEVNKPADPERTGYKFEGWFKDEACTQSYNFADTVSDDFILYAKWTVEYYEIVYDLNGGSFVNGAYKPETYTVDDLPLTLPGKADVAYIGKTFIGWYKDSGLTQPVSVIPDNTTGEFKVYAKWDNNKYTVVIKTPGETDRTEPFVHGQTIGDVLRADPERKGYTFTGYNSKEDGTGTVYEKDYAVTGPLTLYTQWTAVKYKIDYVLNGGTKLNESAFDDEYTIEESVTLPVGSDFAPRAGYTFDGWYKENDFSGTKLTEIPVGTVNTVTLYAKWNELEYSITYKLNDGIKKNADKFVEKYTITSNITLPVAEDFEIRNGYTFEGWYTTDGFTDSKLTVISEGRTGNLTLYAKWNKEEYVINYNNNGGVEKNSDKFIKKYTVTDSFTLPVESDFEEREGLDFKGWYRDSGFTGSTITAITEGTTGVINLYAKWEKTKYEVTFYDMNNVPEKKTYEHGDKISTQMTEPGKNGYDFVAWYTQPNGVGTAYTVDSEVKGAYVLYPYWSAKTYAITYDLKGASKVNEGAFISSYTIEQSVTLPVAQDMELEGHEFKGWYKNEQFTGGQLTNIPVGSTENINLYAKWVKKSYEVKFYVDGILEPKTYSHGDKISALRSDPSKSGYIFKGWTTSPDGTGTVYTKDSVITSALTLYAKWDPESYDIEYVLNDGVKLNEAAFISSYNIETAVTLPTAADFKPRDGWTFEGWYKDSAFATTKLTQIPVGSTGKVVLYAKWVQNTYNITFYDGGEGAGTRKTFTHGDLISSQMSNPSKNGFNFTGWNTSADGKGTNYNSNDKVTFSGNLYAQFEAIKYTITYELGDGYSFKPGYSAPKEFYVTSETITLPTAENLNESATHEFYGWYLDDKLTQSITKVEKGTYNNITVYAKWIEKAKVYHDVVFSYNYTGAPQDGVYSKVSVENDTTVDKPANPERKGYIFGGWFAEAACTNEFDFASAIKTPITIYAKWTLDDYEIKYDLGGASMATESAFVKKYNVETAVTLPVVSDFASRPGYEFKGWFEDADFSGRQVTSIALGTTGNKKFYAKWDMITYEIKYDPGVGTVKNADAFVKNYTVTDSVTLPLVSDFDEMEAYNFIGWFDNENYTGEVITAIPAGTTGDKNFYAKWVKKTYEVKFVVDGAETTLTYEHGDVISSKYPDPSKTGYDFGGWNTLSTGLGITYTGSTPIKQNLILYAKWNAINYNIEYVLDTGKIKNTDKFVSSYNIETSVTLPVASDFEDDEMYEFKGWYENADFSGLIVTNIPVNTTGDKKFYARWEKKSFIVTFDKDGVTTPVTYIYGETLGTKDPVFTKTGYSFEGWNTAINGTGTSYVAESQITGSLTLYAQWKAIPYEIKYNLNGASEGNANAFVKEYNIETAVTLPVESDFAPWEGYEFLGWFDNEELSGEAVSAIPTGSTGDKEFWASWKIKSYNITFHYNGTLSNKTYNHGEKIGLKIDEPTRQGYSFGGWCEDESGLGLTHSQETQVNKSMVLYAKWTPESYAIEYDLGGASKKNESAFVENYTIETSVTLPVESDFELLEGYKFLGWYDNEACLGSAVTSIPAGITGAKKFWAKWEIKTYDVTFYFDDNVPEKKNYEHGDKISTQMTEPGKNGYEFIGWNTKEDGSGTTYQNTDEVTFSGNLYAQFEAIKYTITYELGDGYSFKPGYSAPKEFYVTSETITLPTAENLNESATHEFYGWYLDDEFNQSITIVESGTYDNITVYAYWKEKEKVYHDVIFSYNYTGAPQDGVYSKLPVESGKTVNKPENPEREGYIFGGWFAEAACTNEFDFASAIETPITIYAKWDIETYRISHMLGSANKANEDAFKEEYNVETEIILPVESDFAPFPGYKFDGWYDNSLYSGSKILTIPKGSVGDKTFYAKWDKITYTITYEKDGGIIKNAAAFVEEYTVTDEVILPLATDFEARNDYTFEGWYDNKDFNGEVYTSIPAQSTENKTFWAKWNKNRYDVIFDVDGSEQKEDFEHGEEVSNKVSDPVKTGYTFEYWNTNEEGTGNIYTSSTQITEATTLYAIWRANNYKVEYNAPDATCGTAVYTSEHVYDVEKALSENRYTREGYTFVGWEFGGIETMSLMSADADYTDKQLVTNLASEDGAVVKLYAIWKANEYSVKYDGNGASEGTMANSDFVYDTEAALSKNAYTLPGFKFDGWSTDPDAQSAQYTDEEIVKNLTSTAGKEVVLYAVWSEISYTVKYDGNGATSGEMADSDYGYSESKTLRKNAYAKTGYNFLGWSTDPNAASAEYSDEQLVSKLLDTEGTITLYAIWQVKTYKLIFDVNGGNAFTAAELPQGYVIEDGKATLELTYGSTYPELPVATHSDNKLFFGGWFIDGNEVIAGVTVGDLSNTIVVAKWSDKLIHTVVFNKYNSDGTPKLDEVINGEKVSIPTEPQKEGHSFGGWYADDTFSTVFDFDQIIDYTSKQTIHIYGKWNIDSYTVAFDTDGGSAVEPQTVEFGKTVTRPADPVKENYVFLGWCLGDTEYDFALPVKSGFTLVAKWEVKAPDVYNITYVYGDGEILNEEAFVDSYTTEDEITLPVASDFKERSDGKSFAGWYDNGEFSGTAVKTIPIGSTGDKTFYAKWDQSFIVSFYDGVVVDEWMFIGDKKVASGTSMSQADIDTVLDGFEPYSYEGYVDGSYTHLIYPELWYITDSGEWEIFDDTVVVNSNMNVFYSFKNLSLFFDLEIGEYKLAQPVSFSVPYETDTRVMDSLKDAMTLGRNQIRMALNVDDVYTKAIASASEKSRDLIDAEGNLKYAEVNTPISNIIKASEIDGEIAKYIENIIVDNTEDEKIESAILMVYESELVKDTVLGGMEYNFANIKAYITDLSIDERKEFASDVHDVLAQEQYYKDFISGFEKGHDSFHVTHENLNFVMAVATAVNDYTYEELKDRIYAKFGKVIDILGDDIAKEFMTDAQNRYYDGAHVLWDDMKDHESDASYTMTYPSFLTFKLNAIDHLFRPIYDKYRVKAIERLTKDNIYYYADNTYLRQLVEMDADTIISDLLYTVPKTEENIGYALWPSQGNESGFLHYYDYVLEKLILFDKAMLWYKDNLSSEELEAFKTKAFTDASRALNKANEMLDAYEKDGSLPLGKNIDDLKENEAFAKVFDKLEEKLVTALQKYKSSQFYGKIWDSDSLRNTEFAEEAVNTALGIDDPVFNVDSLLDNEYVVKALDKAGFKDYEYTGDEDDGTFTVQAIERTLKENTVKLRRYYQ